MMSEPPKEIWVNIYQDNTVMHLTAALARSKLDVGGTTAHYQLVQPRRQVRAYVVRRQVRRQDDVVLYEYQDPAGCWTRDRYFADRYTLDRHDSAKYDADAVTEMDSDLPPARVVRLVRKAKP